MPDVQLDEIPEGKVFITKNIAIAAFFGGLPVGAYLLAHNFSVLGDQRKAIITWMIAALLFLLIVFSGFIPLLDHVPAIAYSLVIALAAGQAAKHFQVAKVANHIEKGGDVYSTKRVIAITLIGLAIVVVFVLALFFIQDSMVGRMK